MTLRGEVGGADVVEGDRHVVRNPHADLWMADLLDGQHVLQTQSRVAGLLVTPCHVAQYLDGARQDQGDESTGGDVGDAHPAGLGHE